MQFSALDGDTAPIDGVTMEAEIVAAPAATHRIVVLGYLLTLDVAGTYVFGSDGDPFMGDQSVAASTPVGMACGAGVFRCAAGEPLTLEASQAANGFVRYVVVRA